MKCHCEESPTEGGTGRRSNLLEIASLLFRQRRIRLRRTVARNDSMGLFTETGS
jgi:hypothetical protein